MAANALPQLLNLWAHLHAAHRLYWTLHWQYVDQSTSCVEYAIPTTITPSGGRLVASRGVSTQGEIGFHEHDLRVEPGDTFVITLATVSGAATANATLNWQER